MSAKTAKMTSFDEYPLKRDAQIQKTSILNYLRLVGYFSTLTLHGVNIYDLAKIDLTVSEEMMQFDALYFRYFTVWTFVIQMCHAAVGIYCETLSLRNKKNNNYKLPKYLTGFRDTLFSAILFPSTFLVVIVFWSLYLYDRSLMFPDFIDVILTPMNNHIMHTCIIPLTLWELLFQPRMVPKSHIKNLAHLTFHMVLYLSVVSYTYYDKGLWMYPVFAFLHDKNLMPLAYAILFAITIISYYLQWPSVKLIWGHVYIGKKKI